MRTVLTFSSMGKYMHWRYTIRWTGIVCGNIYNPFCWCSKHSQRLCNVVTAPTTKAKIHFLSQILTTKTSWALLKRSPHDSASRCGSLLLEWIAGASQRAKNTWFLILLASIHLSVDLWIYPSFWSLLVYIYSRTKQPSSASGAFLPPLIFSTLPEAFTHKQNVRERSGYRHMHERTHAHIHAHECTTHTYAHGHTPTHTHSHTHTHTCTHILPHVLVQTPLAYRRR